MNNIVIPMDILNKHGLNINEYLILYDIANDYKYSTIMEYSVEQLVKLEAKGFIKLSPDQIYMRSKAEAIFSVNQDLFLVWLNTYPIRVKKRGGSSTRALSPASDDTILGKKLRHKWESIFKKDVEAQEKAIKVLELQLRDMNKSGDLEYMVEASRWLNEGYHEKYSYLLDESHSVNQYENEDYM